MKFLREQIDDYPTFWTAIDIMKDIKDKTHVRLISAPVKVTLDGNEYLPHPFEYQQDFDELEILFKVPISPTTEIVAKEFIGEATLHVRVVDMRTLQQITDPIVLNADITVPAFGNEIIIHCAEKNLLPIFKCTENFGGPEYIKALYFPFQPPESPAVFAEKTAEDKPEKFIPLEDDKVKVDMKFPAGIYYPPGEYILTLDNDGHWYVIPADKEAAFGEWLELDPDDPASWDPPEWAKEVGGAPSLVKFSNYRIE